MSSWILSVKKREYLKPTYIWLSYHIRLLYLGSRSFMNKLDLSKAIKEVQEVKTKQTNRIRRCAHVHSLYLYLYPVLHLSGLLDYRMTVHNNVISV